MGRSSSSWGKIGLFYFVYYGFLTAFFAACLTVFLSTLNEPGKGGPKTNQFLHGDSAPGLNLVTHVKDFKSHKADIIKEYKTYLNGFNNSGYGTQCVVGSKTVDKLPCKFDLNLLGNCSGINDAEFGTSENKICAFVKMNKVYGWIPKNGNSAYLKLNCYVSKGSADVTVYPDGGYLISAFPFRGEAFYQTPPVAVLINPKQGKVEVSCRLSGDNVKTSDTYVHHRAFGKVKFEL